MHLWMYLDERETNIKKLSPFVKGHGPAQLGKPKGEGFME